jgi:hypothetical protein
MTGPLYHLFIVRGYREAYYQLSAAERDQFWAKVSENSAAAGVKNSFIVYSRWGSEACLAWGIEEYVDLPALLKKSARDDDYNHHRYLDAESYLGMKVDRYPTGIGSANFPNPLYQLVLFKNHNNDSFMALPAAERDHYIIRVVETVQKNGGVLELLCDTDWSNTEITNYAVIVWPSLEAEQSYFKDLAEMDFHRYFYTKTLLGTKLE